MVRSLYDGISGLRNLQVGLDVAANNIANVNTTGFKSGRITFKESMAQLLKGSSRPPGNAGGTNPMQLGLGMAVGSIDTMMTQGNMQSTGQITDLALEGNAFFAYSNGTGTFYSRNGGLQYDANGKMVSPTNGFVLQGMMAGPDGTYPIGSKIGDIRIPFGEKAPAKATGQVSYACNLDSDSEGLGTVIHTNAYLANVSLHGAPNTGAADTVTSLHDSAGNSLGIQAGDTLTISAYDTGGVEHTLPIVVDSVASPNTTLADIITGINTLLAQPGLAAGPAAASLNGNGQIVVNTAGTGATINNLTVHSSRPGSNSYVSNAFSFGASITPADLLGKNSDAFRAPALATDYMSDLYDATGQTLGFEDGDPISINGTVGGKTTPPSSLVFAPRVGAIGAGGTTGTTMQNLLDAIQSAFSLPKNDGTPQNNLSVSMDIPNTPDNQIPDGSIVIRGQKEKAFALTNVSLTATNSNNNAISPTRFNANAGMTEIQAARDTAQHSTSIVVYDESGDAHTMTTTFTNSGTPSEWLWQITMNGGEQILGGSTGRLTFGQDGSPSSWTFDDNSTRFRFDPMNGSNEVDVNLNIGSPGSFTGITQFRSPTTTAARDQDGYPMGKLQEIAIDEFGVIKGIFTNGVNKSLAQIYLADFNNPAGLMKTGDSMFAKSDNSGEAVMQLPGIGTPTKIKPGALEMSNVELATEFTNMITVQRGYQANARVITTSDAMLQELVQLIR
ncbi:MAG: flagellar hook-basal body complex protein [Chitinivibrionales bacterium]|nr:flagellar hook-basal body complex protein [Chitinivibrionales bacterium]